MNQSQSPKEALKALVRNLVSGLAEQQAMYDSSWQPELNAALAAIDQLGVPAEGWRLVPIEPTVAMLRAAQEAPGMKQADGIVAFHQIRGARFSWDGVGTPIEQAWAAMIAAAPKEPT